MKVKIPYVIKKKLADGTETYYYNPPRDAVKAGIVSPRRLGTDLEKEVIPEAKRLNLIMDGWRAEAGRTVSVHAGKQTIKSLAIEYMASDYFRDLDKNVQAHYRLAIHRLIETPLKDSTKTVGDMPPDWLTRRHADQLHSHIKEKHGKHAAFTFIGSCRRMFNVGIRWERCSRNPFEKMEVSKPRGRRVRWTYEQIETFVNKAVELGYTSVAITALLAFELGQRLGDVRRYTWTQYEDGYIRYTQHKTGIPMRTPVEPRLRQILDKIRPEAEAKSPFICVSEDNGKPWRADRLAIKAKEIRQAAGLPDGLWLMDLRRTAATEAEDANVTEGEGMAMTGHTTSDSYRIYAQITDRRVETAMHKRWELRQKRRGESGLKVDLSSTDK